MVVPEGGDVVKQESKQLANVTVRVRPQGVSGADRQESSSTSISGS